MFQMNMAYIKDQHLRYYFYEFLNHIQANAKHFIKINEICLKGDTKN